MQNKGILGGTYVVECTTRDSSGEMGVPAYKHHAHVHMVAVAPYVKSSEWEDWCRMLEPLGLGRIWYEKRAPGCDEDWCNDKRCRHKKDWKSLRDGIAGYISKYITKQARACRTWGVMRKKLPPASPCRRYTQSPPHCRFALPYYRTSVRFVERCPSTCLRALYDQHLPVAVYRLNSPQLKSEVFFQQSSS